MVERAGMGEWDAGPVGLHGWAMSTAAAITAAVTAGPVKEVPIINGPVAADEAAWQAYVALANVARPGQARRTSLLVVGLVALAMILAGTITILGTGGGGTPSGASASVVDAVSSALGDKTASLTLSGSVQEGKITLPVTGTGDTDFTQNAMELHMDIGGSQEGSMTETAEYEGNVMYLNMGTLIGQVIPGKSWLSLNLSQVVKSDDKQLGLGSNSLTNDPLEALKLLTQAGNTAADLGSSTINGTMVEGYSVKMNPTALQGELSSHNLPSWMRQAASLVTSPNLTYQVYITKAGLLDRMSTNMSLTADGQHVNETIAMDFSNFGQSVKIAAPPASQVGSFARFLQIAAAQSQSTEV